MFCHRFVSIALAVIALLGVAHSQAQTVPQLPPPEATDPVTLKLMQGFPPAPDKIVRLSNVLQYPNSRWAYHHMRELGPTATVWRGAGPATSLPQASSNLDNVRFNDAQGRPLSLQDWQRNTYTDALVVLHRGKLVHEQYHVGMQAWQPHALQSMSKSLIGLLTTQLIHEGKVDRNALVTQYLPELKDSAWGDATVQQTLDMTTAAQYEENFAKPDAGGVSVPDSRRPDCSACQLFGAS